MRRPKRWIVVGFLVVAVGIVPIFPTTGRIVVVLLGSVIVLAAISRALARQTGDHDHDKHGPNIDTRSDLPRWGAWGE